jgi:hypothetical protein
MAKVTKTMLKSIVKECLVEILAEGLGGVGNLNESISRKKRVSRKRQQKKSMFDQLDSAFEEKAQEFSSNDHSEFEHKISAAASAATSDPVLKSILEHTAKTTLQDQMNHEQVPGGTNSSLIDSQAISTVDRAGLDIDNLFGEASKNWGTVFDAMSTKKLP